MLGRRRPDLRLGRKMNEAVRLILAGARIAAVEQRLGPFVGFAHVVDDFIAHGRQTSAWGGLGSMRIGA